VLKSPDRAASYTVVLRIIFEIAFSISTLLPVFLEVFKQTSLPNTFWSAAEPF
jgi:hypothetical protein